MNPQLLAADVANVMSALVDTTILRHHLGHQYWLSAIEIILATRVSNTSDIAQSVRGKVFRLLCNAAAEPSHETSLFVILVAGLHRWIAVVHADDWKIGMTSLVAANHRLSQDSVNRLVVASQATNFEPGLSQLAICGYHPSLEISRNVA